MHEKCYRLDNLSTDENLFPIVLRDIFQILEQHTTINKLIFTSRTEVFGALGLFKTYCIQQDQEIGNLEVRQDKIVEGSLNRNGKSYRILVPYSTSPRVLKDNATFEIVASMYKKCLF